jgi:hypothetical protein
MAIEDGVDWADDEFGCAELGDARLTKRLVALAAQMGSRPHCSFPLALSPAELKAAYRFFDNPAVDTDGMLAGHISQTVRRMETLPVVLAVQDTTEFNLNHLPATEGLGYCGNKFTRGFMLHSTLAVSPEGLPLGVLSLRTWTRPIEELGKKHKRRKLAIEDKESIKWLHSLDHLKVVHPRCPTTQLVSVCDREGDIYDLFTRDRPEGVDWLVRAAWNRHVDHPERYLWESMQHAPVLGTTSLRIPGRGKQAERVANMTVRSAPLRVHAPRGRHHQGPDNVDVVAVWAIEASPPEGIEPVEWMLLTSVPTHTLEQALERLSWYARRWTIETWHRVLKSGCQVEARQFGDITRFLRATSLFAVIAWRILFATLLGREEADVSCDVLLQRVEWEALYCRIHRTDKPPAEPPKLGDAVLWIAQLGGYLNRKHDRPPGATVLWRGFHALHEISSMYLIMRKNE